MPAFRKFGGHKFKSHRSGHWISECSRYGIYHMMAGTAAAQWEVFESDTGDPLDGDMIGRGLSMVEAVCEAFNLPFDKVYRRNGIASA